MIDFGIRILIGDLIGQDYGYVDVIEIVSLGFL